MSTTTPTVQFVFVSHLTIYDSRAHTFLNHFHSLFPKQTELQNMI